MIYCMVDEDIKKILVPFDGSKFSKKAVAKAIRMAEKFGAKISFITVVPSGSNPDPSKILGILTNNKKVQKGFHETVCAIRIELKKSLISLVNNSKKERKFEY